MLPLWHLIYAALADPAFDATCLLIIIIAEIHAVYHDRIQTQEAKKQTILAADTYALYKNYFETTEKRKADWREAQRKSRALKKERVIPSPPPEQHYQIWSKLISEYVGCTTGEEGKRDVLAESDPATTEFHPIDESVCPTCHPVEEQPVPPAPNGKTPPLPLPDEDEGSSS